MASYIWASDLIQVFTMPWPILESSAAFDILLYKDTVIKTLSYKQRSLYFFFMDNRVTSHDQAPGLFIGTQTLRCCHPTTRGKFKALSMIDKILSQYHVSFIETTFFNVRQTNWATRRVRNEACIKKKKKNSP